MEDIDKKHIVTILDNVHKLFLNSALVSSRVKNSEEFRQIGASLATLKESVK